jgi:hypothetical protein
MNLMKNTCGISTDSSDWAKDVENLPYHFVLIALFLLHSDIFF